MPKLLLLFAAIIIAGCLPDPVCDECHRPTPHSGIIFEECSAKEPPDLVMRFSSDTVEAGSAYQYSVRPATMTMDSVVQDVIIKDGITRCFQDMCGFRTASFRFSEVTSSSVKGIMNVYPVDPDRDGISRYDLDLQRLDPEGCE